MMALLIIGIASTCLGEVIGAGVCSNASSARVLVGASVFSWGSGVAVSVSLTALSLAYQSISGTVIAIVA